MAPSYIYLLSRFSSLLSTVPHFFSALWTMCLPNPANFLKKQPCPSSPTLDFVQLIDHSSNPCPSPPTIDFVLLTDHSRKGRMNERMMEGYHHPQISNGARSGI